ncbi:MAG: hypothetical protein N3H32_00050 [Nitrososphaeria archaeon]|nr:hypothetical protein [Nitrososphaeria archaeon]MDW8043630.1 hypothetical protein [Nitrososphaerota archaeon]
MELRDAARRLAEGDVEDDRSLWNRRMSFTITGDTAVLSTDTTEIERVETTRGTDRPSAPFDLGATR